MNTLKIQLAAFMLSCVDFESAGYEEQENTLQNVASNLWSECAQYNRGTDANKFTEGLQGLPSYINLPFYNGEIEDLMYAFGYEGSEAVDIYWNLCGEVLAEQEISYEHMMQG